MNWRWEYTLNGINTHSFTYSFTTKLELSREENGEPRGNPHRRVKNMENDPGALKQHRYQLHLHASLNETWKNKI